MKYLSVVFVLLILVAAACKKKEKVAPSLTSLYTKKLAKDWKWKGNWTNRFRGVILNDSVTTGTYNDTVMGISVVNDSMIVFNGNSYSYVRTAGYFGNNYIQVDEENMLVYIDKANSTPHTIFYINYYYIKDSIAHTYKASTSGAHIEQVYYTVN